MMTYKTLFPGIVLSFFILVSAAAIPELVLAVPQQQSKQEREAGVVQVEAKYVCMINNQRFDKEQIAIKVNQRTYYGCCEMCKERLQKDPRSRVAVDPVSGQKVDKAKAVIGAGPDGKIYYFESVENLKRFRAAS